jgi:hypothetical protein
MAQNKIRNVGRVHLSEKERPLSEALDKKPTNVGQVVEDGGCNQPALRAQMFFVPTQDVSQGRKVTHWRSIWDNGTLSKVIEKLFERF